MFTIPTTRIIISFSATPAVRERPERCRLGTRISRQHGNASTAAQSFRFTKYLYEERGRADTSRVDLSIRLGAVSRNRFSGIGTKMQQRVLVCGGRDYSNREWLFQVLDLAHEANPIVVLIHGNAKGADQLADEWAAGKCETLTFTPAWEEHGKAAGPMRNQKMLDEGKPDLVIAFPGGRGTADMVRRAKAANVPVCNVLR